MRSRLLNVTTTIEIFGNAPRAPRRTPASREAPAVACREVQHAPAALRVKPLGERKPRALLDHGDRRAQRRVAPEPVERRRRRPRSPGRKTSKSRGPRSRSPQGPSSAAGLGRHQEQPMPRGGRRRQPRVEIVDAMPEADDFVPVLLLRGSARRDGLGRRIGSRPIRRRPAEQPPEDPAQRTGGRCALIALDSSVMASRVVSPSASSGSSPHITPSRVGAARVVRGARNLRERSGGRPRAAGADAKRGIRLAGGSSPHPGEPRAGVPTGTSLASRRRRLPCVRLRSPRPR